MIRDRIELYMEERLHLCADEIPSLRRYFFDTYGTTLRGLQMTSGVDSEDFLAYVHDVPVEDCLSPNPALKAFIVSLPLRKVIFTNADTRHAKRVLAALDLEGVFDQIIDIHHIAPNCKPQPEAYLKALAVAGESKPETVAVIDDSARNLQTAHSLGFYTALVHSTEPDGQFDQSIYSILDLQVDFPFRKRNLNGG